MSDAAPPPEDEPISAELVPTDQTAGTVQVVAGGTPAEITRNAEVIAAHLKSVIKAQGLSKPLGGGREHVEVGGWQLAGTLMGALGGVSLHAETVWTRRVLGEDGKPERTTYTQHIKRYHAKSKGGGLREEVTAEVDGYSWEARVEVRTVHGEIVGSAEAMCARTEETWSRRDDYALRSMAETRAESRAYRRAIGWVIHLAGFNPTPAEEMGGGDQYAPEPAGPMFGPQLPEQNQAMVREALLQILEVPGGPPPAELARSVIGAVRQVVASYGVEAYTPDIAGAVFVKIAEALAYARSVAEQAQASPSAAAPADASPSTSTATAQPSGRVDPPDFATIADLNADAQLQAFRAVGCKCPSPPLPALPNRVPRYSPDCPVIGHEADGLGAT